MPFVPAPNICEVEMRATRNNQQVENRIMVDMLAAPTAPAMQDLADIAWAWWASRYAPVLSNECNLREVVVTDLSLQNGLQVTYAPATNVIGAINTGALPNEVSVCVSLRTGVRGRSARGRFYTLSVCGDQMANSNEISVVADGLISSAVAQLITDIRTSGVEPVIVSYVNNKVPRPGGPVYFSITGVTITDRIVDSMKRRKPGVGA
jgi:hypothetical protein